jgi:four helix bundle protein
VRIERFEDLKAWQRAREMTRLVYQLSAKGSFGADFALRDQIRRASISVMSNIAEGFDRAGRKEFRQALVVAKGSCAEVRAQTYIALDVGHLSTAEFESLQALALETSKIINGLRTSLSRGIQET